MKKGEQGVNQLTLSYIIIIIIIIILIIKIAYTHSLHIYYVSGLF